VHNSLKISRKKLVRVYNVHGLLKKIVVGNARIKYQSYIFFSPLSMFHLLGEFKNHLSLSSSIKLQNIKCVGFYWRFHMMFLLSECCVMDSKSSTASVNISLNSGSERKLTQLIIEDDTNLNKNLYIEQNWFLIWN
jgi:hypothetical protein